MRWQPTISTVADMFVNPQAGVTSSSIIRLQNPLLTDLNQTLSGKGYRRANRKTTLGSLMLNPQPPTSIYPASSDREADWSVWQNALCTTLGKDQSAEVDVLQSIPQSIGSRIPKPLPSNYSNTNTLDPPSLVGGERDSEKEKSRIVQLANLVKRARERSRCVNEDNRVGAFVVGDLSVTKSAMVGRSTRKSSPNCTSAAESPSESLSTAVVVMDIESDVEAPWHLSRRRSRTLSSGSAQHLMHSVRSSSSSSARSSPLCVTPDLPGVPLPLLPQSVPVYHMNGKRGISSDNIRPTVTADVYPLESSVADMALHHSKPSIDTNSSGIEHVHCESTITLPSTSTLLSSDVNTSWRTEDGPSYLSRSQRRLARTVINPSCHDVQNYLYEGGQTGVVSGGVMLGPQVQGKKSGQRCPATPKGQESHQHRKTKKAQGKRPPKPKNAQSP
ncbi:hypothetical protein F5876DRAFT_80412 [Lentinula aff. lateritia]|uniref:Uncharacterized protein n=1 Tax=Lentinula aff. lateritia TaxID=2804960 RepID=A0ACC1TPS6_9AGAR|nr:hypothetical protein F5876DRAFT_80412 [Lentinula aff. lateritia]